MMLLRTRLLAASPEAALARPPRQLLPLAGAGASITALLWVQATGPRAGDLLPALIGALALALLGLALLARVARALRQGDAIAFATALLAVLFAVVLYSSTAVLGGAELAFAFWLSLLGGALIASRIWHLRRMAAAGSTPWQAIAGGSGRTAERNRVLGEVSAVLVGAIMLLIGTNTGVRWLLDRASAIGSGFFSAPVVLAFAALAAFGILAVLVVALVVWLLRASRRPGAAGLFLGAVQTPTGAPTSPHHDEPAIAAHLHDSVLQTLALIGRNADDPARVKQLALQQERSLRDWLAGRDGSQADSLAAAVRLVAQEVEDEEPGVRVEVVAVGDAPLDRAADAMVRAAREAIRNAARHAGSPVRVFVEVDGAVRELFVRDTGPGFDLATVADERRGVRDAIIGRVQHVGGSAAIDSGPTGTEIALRYEDRG